MLIQTTRERRCQVQSFGLGTQTVAEGEESRRRGLILF